MPPPPMPSSPSRNPISIEWVSQALPVRPLSPRWPLNAFPSRSDLNVLRAFNTLLSTKPVPLPPKFLPLCSLCRRLPDFVGVANLFLFSGFAMPEMIQHRLQKRQHAIHLFGANHHIPQWLELFPRSRIRQMP